MSGQRVVAIGRVAVSNRGVLTPAQLPGLLLWLDGSDGSTITQSGGLVSAWADKSGLSNNATGTNKPTFVSSSLNGKSGIQWTNAANSLATPAMSVGTFTIFSVVKLTVVGMVYQQATSGNGFWMYGDNDGTGSVRVTTSVAESGKNAGVNWAITSTPLYLTHTFGGTHASHLLRKSGVSVSLVDGGSTGNPGTGGTSAILYFGRDNGSALGVHYEHIIYNRVLSSAEISAIEGFIRSKWGL